MKFLFFILFLTTSLSAFSDYNDDYRENEDGSSTYIGTCILHEDYRYIKFKVIEVVPTAQYPTANFFKNLTPLYRKLAAFVHNEELGPDEVDEFPDLDGFDDISFDLVITKNSKALHRVNYGVGGGNGGYTTFRVSKNEKIELVAKTFDGDLLFCHKDFRK